jgi:hypothetical protein
VLSAVVLGNGESRRLIDLHRFQNNHVLFGCNAIHRDLIVDHLVCCDRRMVDEALSNPQIKNTLIYVRPSWYQYFKKIKKNKNIRLVPDIPYEARYKQDDPIHWGSGCFAVLLAAVLGHEKIKMVGFDLYSDNQFVNNIYKGTANYSASNKEPVDPTYWIYQISKLFDCYTDRQFEIHNQKNWKMPREWNKNNVSFIEI